MGACWSSTADTYLYYGYMHETNILASIGGYSLDRLPSSLKKYVEQIASSLSNLDKSKIYYDILKTDSSSKDDAYQVRCMLIEE